MIIIIYPIPHLLIMNSIQQCHDFAFPCPLHLDTWCCQVYSWGNGDGGRLGHGDSNSREEPTLVQELQGKTVVSIACGSTYSAAITNQGELYTWGRGNYGRLGHGSSDDHSVPTLVTALKGVWIYLRAAYTSGNYLMLHRELNLPYILVFFVSMQ